MFWGDVPPLKLLSSLMLALKVFSIFRCAGVQWRRSTTPLFMMRSATVVIGAEFLLWCYPEWYEHQLWIVYVYTFVCLFVFVCACVRMLVARAVLQTPLDRINPWYKSLVEVSAPPSLSLSLPPLDTNGPRLISRLLLLIIITPSPLHFETKMRPTCIPPQIFRSPPWLSSLFVLFDKDKFEIPDFQIFLASFQLKHHLHRRKEIWSTLMTISLWAVLPVRCRIAWLCVAPRTRWVSATS